MLLSELQRRRLHATSSVWLDRIEVINQKAALQQSKLFQINEHHLKEGQFDEKEARRNVESVVLGGLRRLFPVQFANRIFSELSHLTIPDIHILVLALEHLFRSLKHLRPSYGDEACKATDVFIEEWKKVREIRNGLEHEEEYLAGVGKYDDLPDKEWTPPMAGASRNTKCDTNGFVEISVLGKSYNVQRSIEAALNLRPHLSFEASRVALRDNK